MNFKSNGEKILYENFLSQFLQSDKIKIAQVYLLKKINYSEQLCTNFAIFYGARLLGIIEINEEQHRKDDEYLTPIDIEKQQFCKSLNIDYVWCDYHYKGWLNFDNWYYENSYWLGYKLPTDYHESWWHTACFEHLLNIYDKGHNLMDIRQGLYSINLE